MYEQRPAAGKLDYIDAIRGIAVLGVIFVHTSQRVSNLSPIADLLAAYSQMGVQLFFVASAYTMCLAWGRRRDESRPLLSFYLRRIFRIAPLYWLAILLYSGVHVAKQAIKGGGLSLTEPFTSFNIGANALFIHGFVPAANNSIVPGGWSIGTEMAFYLIFPVLLVLMHAMASSRIKLWVVAAMAAGINMLLQQMWAMSGEGLANNSFMYFHLLNQLPVFLVGMIAFFDQPRKRRGNTAGPWIAFALVTLVALLVWRLSLPLTFVVMPALAGLSFYFLMTAFRQVPWKDTLLCRIGRVSYSMYVLHFLFAWFVWGAIAPRLPHWLPAELQLLAAFPLVVACTYGVARLTERFIERPGIAFGARFIANLQQRGRLRSTAFVHTTLY